MSNVFEQINSIPLNEILDALGIHYDLRGNNLNLYEGDKYTDWWRWNLEQGYVKDFTGKRPEGDRITFVMGFLNLDKKETVDWYKQKFGIIEEQRPRNEQTSISNVELLNIIWQAPAAYKIQIKNKWESLPQLNEAQVEYLKNRGIDAGKLIGIAKNNNGYIACPIWDMSGMITIQSRTIKSEWPRFMIEKWTNSKWVFMHNINKEDRTVYVVEGLVDYLSLIQFTPNVIGMKSATDGFEMVREFYNRGYKIILIPDADEAGKSVIEKFHDIKFSLFDVGKYWVKDINDLLVEWNYGHKILDLINNEREKEPIPIDKAFEKFEKMKEKIRERGRLGFDSPFPKIDRYTQGIIEGKTYTIGAFSNTGKSQFSYAYVQHFLKMGKKVGYFSLEVDIGMLLSHVAKSYYAENYHNIMIGKKQVIKEDFKNLYLYDDVFTVAEIHKITEKEWFDIIFIDYIQALQWKGSSSTEKFEDIALGIQQIGIQTNAVVFSISQVNNESRWKHGDSVMLKGSGSFFAASDVVFILSQDTASFLRLDITKNKFGKKTSFLVNPEFEIWQFSVAQTTEFEEPEEKNTWF